MKRAVLALCVSSALAIVSAAGSDSLDESFKKFWEARNPQDASKAADRIAKSGIGFDAALARLKAGRAYATDVPAGWRDAPWWNDVQVENVEAILDSVKRTYNMDENRRVLSGVSDGATGLYYMAMRDTTPFASFLPLNGYLMVLSSAALDIRTELFPNNLLNKPFFIVNGGNGQLFKHERRSGRVDLVRTGNVVEADARGVAEFTLLLSPDAFDFAQPVKVVANGRVAFEGTVEKSVATLLKWAARDNDRTMPFGAELRIKVP